MAKHIEHWAIDKLVPFSRYTRMHSDAHVAQIAGSIPACAIQSPILVNAHTAMTGSLRLSATRDIGLRSAPVIEPYNGECHAN
jgi:hypothetical protein